MSVMDLKTLCMNNLVDLIKNLPLQLKEEVIGVSIKAIKADAKKEIIKEIKNSATIVVDDVTDCLISSSRTGKSWQRPEYTKNIDDELYQTFVLVAEQFVNKHAEKLILDNAGHRLKTAMHFGYGDDTSEEEDSD